MMGNEFSVGIEQKEGVKNGAIAGASLDDFIEADTNDDAERFGEFAKLPGGRTRYDNAVLVHSCENFFGWFMPPKCDIRAVVEPGRVAAKPCFTKNNQLSPSGSCFFDEDFQFLQTEGQVEIDRSLLYNSYSNVCFH